jgi:hypothetical protein
MLLTQVLPDLGGLNLSWEATRLTGYLGSIREEHLRGPCKIPLY